MNVSFIKWGGRISNYTGLPTIVGWDYHEKQRRSLEPLPQLVSQRIANVNAFYTTQSMFDAINILRHYEVAYVIVSNYEVERYGSSGGLAKFDVMAEAGLLVPVYKQSDAVIYAVDQEKVFDAWAAELNG